MLASYPCFRLCLMYLILYTEAIVTSFLYSGSYHAHGGAIVAVFFSGLSMTQCKGGNKTAAHPKAMAEHASSITVCHRSGL